MSVRYHKRGHLFFAFFILNPGFPLTGKGCFNDLTLLLITCASRIAPLLRQKSICSLRPRLSVSRTLEQMGQV